MGISKTLPFRLNEIANWQLKKDSQVELPSLQRGFVWKANQIETLWDSILRGYPIGSFLLSQSTDEKLFLMDGQQRATSIALGFYNPWDKDAETSFWSVKNLPVLWVDISDLDNSKVTNTQKFVLRVVTQSHPWGYQRKNNSTVLSVSDRTSALDIFDKIPENKGLRYIKLSNKNIFPYDADLPVPLSFIIKALADNKIEDGWKESLINLCKSNLPVKFIQTKYFKQESIPYVEKLTEVLNNSTIATKLYIALERLTDIEIPGIVVNSEILKDEEEQTGEDPTLFVRLNSSGTRIGDDELIYSIYKASFPEAKQLVEDIGASFVAPSLVISLASRLVLSEINNGSYPNPLNVNDFRKRIKDENFKIKLKEFINNENRDQHFKKAFELLLSSNDISVPAILVKNIVKASPDLFLMLLQAIKLRNIADNKKVLAAVTALAWFGRDNNKYVREIWTTIGDNNFWSKSALRKPYYNNIDYIMFPLIDPDLLRNFLTESVIENKIEWANLYPNFNNKISKIYQRILGQSVTEIEHMNSITKSIWDSFINRVCWNKSFILFAQRKYINEAFGEFNQMDTLEDTNRPWDWDHIYPDSWVYYQQNINANTRHWNNSIGNFRALALQDNRRQNNNFSPRERLMRCTEREISFVLENDWEFWSRIENRINEGNSEMIKIHLQAIINRLCNIYAEWYFTLDVGELFGEDIVSE